MPANKKIPDQRKGGQSSALDDPRFITSRQAISKRQGIAIPKPNPRWHAAARSWFNSLALSGQSDLYEASDWATAVAAAEALDIFYKTHNAATLGHFVRLSERLGVTIVDRQKNRVELLDSFKHDVDEDAADEAVTGWHLRLQQGEAS